MDLESYRHDDCVDFTAAWEKKTLDNFATQTSDAPDDAHRHSHYGKNGSDVDPQKCSPRKIGSWSLTSDGALLAFAAMAKRWQHEPTLKFLARNYEYALSICPWWMETFRTLPGEYAKLEPCWTRPEIRKEGDDGDTDFWRHYGSLGLLRLGADPAIRAFGNWTDADVEALTDLHFDVAVGSITGLGQGELLRWSYQHDMLLGCADAYRMLGDREKAQRAWDYVTTIWHIRMGQPIWAEPVDAEGNTRPLLSYGPRVFNSIDQVWQDPWRYGWFDWGGQSWYYGHICQSMIQAAFGAITRGDRVFFGQCVTWIAKITAWCDPRLRATAPTVPLSSPHDPVKMHNVLIHGGTKIDAPDGPYITTRSPGMDLDDYENLGRDTIYHRHCYADKYFHADGGVWDRFWTAPDNTRHARRHWSNGTRQPDRTSLDALNAHGLLSGLWARAAIFNDAELARWFEVWTVEALAFANTTDKPVSIRKATDSVMLRGSNLVSTSGRLTSWVLKAGWEGRGQMVAAMAQAEGDEAGAAFAAAASAAHDANWDEVLGA